MCCRQCCAVYSGYIRCGCQFSRRCYVQGFLVRLSVQVQETFVLESPQDCTEWLMRIQYDVTRWAFHTHCTCVISVIALSVMTAQNWCRKRTHLTGRRKHYTDLAITDTHGAARPITNKTTAMRRLNRSRRWPWHASSLFYRSLALFCWPNLIPTVVYEHGVRAHF